MEFIEGQDLRSLVKQRGPFPVREAVEYVIQAGAGLACAHARGIWHRNVKPGNLMVDRSGVIRVTGFGLAHVEASEEAGSAALTIQGQAMGTGDYMAPEQTLDAGSVDARADIYSLGCTLCMLLTGRPPYRATSWEQMVGAHLTAPIPSLTEARGDVPQALNDLFQKMLAKQPADRYGSMEEVIAALRGSLVSATPAWPEPEGPATPALPPTDISSPLTSEIGLPDLPPVSWPEPDMGGMPAVPPPGFYSPDTSAGPLDRSYLEMVKPRQGMPPWVFRTIAYGTSILLGLILGALIVKWLVQGSRLPLP
jgi:serine/threonine protein kinase